MIQSLYSDVGSESSGSGRNSAANSPAPTNVISKPATPGSSYTTPRSICKKHAKSKSNGLLNSVTFVSILQSGLTVYDDLPISVDPGWSTGSGLSIISTSCKILPWPSDIKPVATTYIFQKDTTSTQLSLLYHWESSNSISCFKWDDDHRILDDICRAYIQSYEATGIWIIDDILNRMDMYTVANI